MKKSTLLYKKFILLLTLLLLIGGFSVGIEAQSYHNGTWYSLYDATEYSTGTSLVNSDQIKTYSPFVPTNNTYSIDTRLPLTESSTTSWSKTKGDPHSYDYSTENYQLNIGNVGTVTVEHNVSIQSTEETKTENEIVSIIPWKTKEVTYYRYRYTYTYNNVTKSGSGIGENTTSVPVTYVYKYANRGNTVYVSNMHIPMAKHIRLKSSTNANGVTEQTKNAFANTTWGTTCNESDKQLVYFRSFLTNGNITITAKHYPNVFRIGDKDNTSGKTLNVGANAFACLNNSKATCSAGVAGDASKYTFSIYFHPEEVKAYNDTIIITDGTSTAYVYVSGRGAKRNQTIKNFSSTAETHNTTDAITTFAAYAADAVSGDSTKLPITYSSNATSIATVGSSNGVVTIVAGGGTVTFTARQAGNDWYNEASKTVTYTINKVTPTIATQPTVGTVSYLATLNSCAISNNGLATVTWQGTPNTTVDGKFEWTTPTQRVEETAGSHNYSMTFTPNDGGKFTTKVFDRSVTVLPINQSIVMNNCTIRVAVDGIDAGAANSSVNLNTLINSQTTDPIDNKRTGAVTYEVISSNKGNTTLSGSTFSATVVDVYTIRATKAATEYYNEATADFTVTVLKRDNTLAISGTEFTKYVEQEVTDVRSGQNSDATVQTSSTDATIAYYDVTNNRIVIPNSGAKSFTSTTVTICIWQDATSRFEASGTKTITLTVNKYANTIVCDWNSWSKDLATDDGAFVNFSSDNTEEGAPAINVAQTSGDDVATYYPDDHALYTGFKLGTATWTVSQAENYKYAGDTKTLTVNVITVTEGCYVYGPAITDKEASKVGEINLPKAGAGNVLSFQMKYNGLGGQAKVIAFDANGNQLEEWYPETGYPYVSYDGGHEITLPAGTKKVNFQCPGSGAHALDDPYINNIRISRTEWINLQDVDGNTITSLEKMTNTIGGNSATATFYVDYSVCASEVRVASNNAHVTVSPASFTPTAERQMITVTYTSATPETIDATITVYTSSQNATLNLTAETEKQTPYLIWGSLYQAEPVSLPVTFSDDAAATASNDAVVTYSIRSGEESVISIAADSRSFTIVGEGTAHLTATSAESTMWKSVSETKEINTTNKKIQNIVWDQNFTRGLKLNDERALTAEVSVYDFAAGTEEVSAARTALIQYTCPAANGVIEKIDATHFRVIGYGETTITASVAGNEEYEAASSVTKLVNVREAQTGVCDPALMTEVTNEIKFEAFSLGFPEVSHEVELDRSKGQPDKLSFYVRGVSYNLAIEYYVGGIDVYESTDGGEHWSDILASVNPEKNTTAYSEQIQLSPDATHLRFVRAQGGQGYHYVGGINVTAIPELRVANAELDLGNIGCGATYNGNIGLSYFNVKGDLSVAKANSTNGLSIEETIDAECGTTQTINVPFSVFPTEEGTWSNTVTITDELQHMSVEVHMTANVTKADQEIIWEPTLTVTGNNPPVLNAYATSGLPVTYEVTSGSNATIVNNEVVISGTGSFTITVSQAGNVSYHAASLSKTFNVNPLTLILHSPAASDITTDQKLGDSQLSGGSAEDNEHNAVAGTWAWYDDVETTYAAGEYTPHVIFTPAANSGWYENVITTTALTVLNGQFIYTGTGDWNTEGNWNVGSVPTSSDEVLIEGNVTVSGNVSVQSLTIAQGADVTLNVSGKLNIGSGNSQNLTGYGDLHVREGGQVNLSNGTLKVRNFTLDAALSGTKGGVHQNAASGQVANPTKLDVRGEAYFVLTIDPADALTYGWYDFTVPFEVEISDGIYRYGENTPMRSGVDFMIMEYSESRRASGMKGWVNASGTLQPGRAYTITLDKWAYTTYVFKKKAGASAAGTNSFSAVASDAESQTRGWNGLGNGSLSHAQLIDAFSNAKVQLYDHAHNVYVTKEANESNFAVGTAFFIQVSEAQTIPFAAAEENRTLMAPSREVYTMDEFRLTLKDTETDNTTDRLWLSASEEATEEYVIGQDLLKMGTPTSGTVAQMWTMKGGKVLCDVETAMNGERATAPLSFYAPKAGQYELAIDQAPEDVTLYLTYNDQVIWILSFGSYVFDLEKGTTEGYGLRMETNRAPQIATGIDEQTTGAQNRKVMINNTLYIVTAEGAIFDVMGKNIK